MAASVARINGELLEGRLNGILQRPDPSIIWLLKTTAGYHLTGLP